MGLSVKTYIRVRCNYGILTSAFDQPQKIHASNCHHHQMGMHQIFQFSKVTEHYSFLCI